MKERQLENMKNKREKKLELMKNNKKKMAWPSSYIQ